MERDGLEVRNSARQTQMRIGEVTMESSPQRVELSDASLVCLAPVR